MLYKHFFFLIAYNLLVNEMLKIGDLVTRKSYNNDVIFQIINIEDEIYYLKGLTIRLCADSSKEDLQLVSNENEEDETQFLDRMQEELIQERDEYFYIPGRILHIDGDSDYLEKSLKFYKKLGLEAYGINTKESQIAENILQYILDVDPTIVVITGHDAYYKKRSDQKYRNTSYFVEAIKKVRSKYKDNDQLVIIAGACQSDYDALIKAGADFASSPKRVNIHALDPAVIAATISLCEKNENVDLIKTINKTKYGSDGMGGLKTKGKMLVGYPKQGG